MPENIIQIDQNLLETRLDRLVAEKVAELLNAMLDAEADEIANAAKYERTGERKAYRAGHYDRSLTAKAGRLALKVPKLKGAVFESAVIERYRRREESVEEALIDMYLAGVSTRQVDDISQLLWGDRMPSQTLSDKLKKVYGEIEAWRTRPLCLCSISCCGFSHDDFSGLGRACRPRNGLNWMVLVSPPERTGKDYDQHAPS
ncbi:transposase, partial [Bifidobacterium longum]|uniref:transposase n=1 Tax=Bifidobacterium longum TaxID=216816 RepID=UPI001F60E5BA